MADENLDEHFVELVSSVSHANGVFRVTLAQQVEAGSARPVTRLLIPANQLQAVLRPGARQRSPRASSRLASKGSTR